MRRIYVRHAVLLAGAVLLFGCGGPHEIDERPASGSESEERAPAESEAAEPDDAAPAQPADEESEEEPSDPQP